MTTHQLYKVELYEVDNEYTLRAAFVLLSLKGY